MRSVGLSSAALAAVFAASCAGDAPKDSAGVDGGAADAAGDVAQDTVADVLEDGVEDSANAVCDPRADFGAPVLLAGTNLNTLGDEGGPRLTADELTLYFSGAGSRDGGRGSDLFVAHRATKAAPFDPPTPLTALDSADNEYDPTTVTELTILFTSDRTGGLGSNDLYAATRASTALDFVTVSALAAPLNSASSDAQPFLRADQAELWFASNRPGGSGAHDIYRAAMTGTSFGTPERVVELATSFDDFTPLLSADGLVVFFSSTRTDGGALGAEDVWTASRAQVTDAFSDIRRVSAVNSSDRDFPGWLSEDRCRLYMSSTRPGVGGEDIYVATRGQ